MFFDHLSGVGGLLNLSNIHFKGELSMTTFGGRVKSLREFHSSLFLICKMGIIIATDWLVRMK